MTGNPVRQDLFNSALSREEAVEFFGLDASKKTILVVGGSLGARTINQSIAQHINDIKNSNVQLIWQTGKSYDAEAQALLEATPCNSVKQMAFISRMDMAYKAADLVISRAGASSISELCLLEKPVILVPSPNVAEDHQRKNAQALVDKDAAVMILDADCRANFAGEVKALLTDDNKRDILAQNIKKMALVDADEKIVDKIYELLNK
jgi:UDP-N-acetylglucosamine--N-acetylmuramyl-(pentapeptide) pyrophosphoryl-undecaprenol N-acetylglucosamine transferase